MRFLTHAIPTWSVAIAALILLASAALANDVASRPNIVLVVFDDLSPRLSVYGDGFAQTPVLERFAQRAIRYQQAFASAPVCAPSRAALLTGVHQQTLGASHMRTSAFGSDHAPDGFEVGYDAVPPTEVRAFPELLRRAGYHTINGFGGWPFSDKKDYQFGAPFTMWDQDGVNSHWRHRPAGAPFFMMATLATTHEGFLWPEEPIRDTPLAAQVAAFNRRLLAGRERIADPRLVRVPPYLPDTALVRENIARLYDNLRFTEQRLDELLAALEADGLLDNTVVIVTSDHGDGLPRAKRSLYDSGLRVPLLIRLPRQTTSETRESPVSLVDLAPSILSLANVSPPPWMQGRALLGEYERAGNRYVFAALDRNYDLPDRARAVRDRRYALIRNYRTDVPLLRPLEYRDHVPAMMEIWRLYSAGELNPLQRAYVEGPRPYEELYDTLEDPDQVANLIDDPRYHAVRRRLRRALDTWLETTPDLAATSEREMVEGMWPGLVQPVTSAPTMTAHFDGHSWRVSMASGTVGASIGYRLADDREGSWRIYTAPFAAVAGAAIEAKAIRYGYAESPISRVQIGQMEPLHD